MTIDIKQSWFQANWNKPKRMKKVMRRYNKKINNVSSIIYTANQYGIEIPSATTVSINDKAKFYWKQYYKLTYFMVSFLNGETNAENKDQMIREYFETQGTNNSKYVSMKHRPDGYPKWEPLPPAEPIKHVDKGFFAKLLGK